MGMDVGNVSSLKTDINVTPLVDIVLVLLIIFMVIMPVVQMGFEMEIPEKAKSDVPAEAFSEQVLLRMTADYRMFLNTEEVTLNQLPSRISEIYQKRRSKTIFFFAEDQTNYGEVVNVMDICRNNGVSTIGLVSELQQQ
jgi:biopolymer transport protein ExbD